jgi:4-hydroxybenzoate polyprenyltransferase
MAGGGFMRGFLALSRTLHAALDIAAPAFCALVWLGRFPTIHITLLALLTAFAAYTSVYALNDLVGLRDDKEKFAASDVNPGYSMDASASRHPVAQGALGVRDAVIWCATWFALAVAGSYLLNQIIVLVLLAAVGIEVFYCRLLKVTYLRTALSGLVKTSGPVAAVLVVDPTPHLGRLLLLVAWLFFWEIGGQNIPSDWNDTAEDRRVEAKTIPLQFGRETAGRVILLALTASVGLSTILTSVSGAQLGPLYVFASLLVGTWLLLRPALRLYGRQAEGRLAARLFESASYYPLAMLGLICSFLAAGWVLDA